MSDQAIEQLPDCFKPAWDICSTTVVKLDVLLRHRPRTYREGRAPQSTNGSKRFKPPHSIASWTGADAIPHSKPASIPKRMVRDPEHGSQASGVDEAHAAEVQDDG